MNLKFIKDEKCPICGCSVIIEETIEKDMYSNKYREHCNGGRWEQRKFACGQKIEYIPNGSIVEISKIYHCENDPKLKLMQNKRKLAKNTVNSFIDNLDVDDEYKEMLKSDIRWR
jgi:hypothetical protein